MLATAAKGNTSPGPSILRPEDFLGLEPVRRLAGRNRTKADILVYRLDGIDIAVKDYSRCPWGIRQSLGRFFTRREAAAYRRLCDLEGLPRCHGRLGPYMLATDWVEARTLSEFEDNTVPDSAFEKLREVVTSVHRREVALVDLNYRDVLFAADGSVVVVDLAMAWIGDLAPRFIRRRIFEHFRRNDLWALSRLRSRFSVAKPPRDSDEAGSAAVAWHRRARKIKWYWDRLRGAPRLPPADW